MTDIKKQSLFGGLSGVELSVDYFDLGHGVTISKTYAHLMSPLLMAFTPAPPGSHHPPPWVPALGGFGLDIHVQIFVPESFKPTNWMDRHEAVWWITAMIRMFQAPFVTLPVISDMPFSEVSTATREANLLPMEMQERIFSPGKEYGKTIREETLEWVKQTWFEGGELMKKNSKFNTAFRAFDSSAIRGRASLAMISLWGGLEQLFSPSAGELRFRVSAMLASYLEPPGEERYKLYKQILKLYDARSNAAHTAGETDNDALISTWVLMRNALVKMLRSNHIPSREELEEYLFGLKTSPDWQ